MTRDIPTPHGVARAQLEPVAGARAALVLGHGAAGGVSAPDLTTVADVARSERVAVALVEQPYRVAGRRSPAPAHQLDAAWLAVIEDLRRKDLVGLKLLVGGRSSGARVACRTAHETGAAGVLCLAFPLRPPRPSGRAPAASRLFELEQVTVPTLVVQGASDPFGVPPPADTREVVVVPGNHSLRSSLDAVAEAARAWLARVAAEAAGTAA